MAGPFSDHRLLTEVGQVAGGLSGAVTVGFNSVDVSFSGGRICGGNGPIILATLRCHLFTVLTGGDNGILAHRRVLRHV